MNNGTKKNVRILCILPTIRDCGGIEAFYFNYYNLLPKNVSVDFITHSLSSKKYERMVKDRGDNIYCLPSFSLRNIRMIKKQTIKILKTKQYDAIHCNMANAAFLYLKLAKKYRICNRILHSHQDKYASKAIHSIRNIPLVKIGKRYATINLACSKKAGLFLFGKKRFSVIYNAVDLTRYIYSDSYRSEIREKYSINEKTLLIGCIGRLDRQKNQAFAIKIISEITDRDCKLLLIGDGEDESKLRQLVKCNKLCDKIIFVGATDDVYKYYSAIDLLLMPSIYEGLGMVAIEAQLSGCPVLASSELPIESKISGLIRYYDLNESIMDWVNAVKEIRIKKRESLKNNVDKYDIKKQTKMLLRLYTETNNE